MIYEFAKLKIKIEVPYKDFDIFAKDYISKDDNYDLLIEINKEDVQKELDLMKAAKAVNEKSIEMLKQKDLLPLTGYIHGGCSPIGMKKFFKTTIDDSAKQFQTIIFSAGKIGYQVEVTLEDLSKVIRYDLCDITKDVEL